MRYFTADWHFGHSNIIDYTGRPHASVDNMDSHFLREMNNTLSSGDEIWCLGDLCGPRTRIDNLRACLSEIPCEVHWIKGNHDPDPEAVSDLAEFHGQRVEMHTSEKQRDGHDLKLVLDHYPMHSWNARYHGAIQLHGHVHGQIDNHGMRRGDVGVDTDGWDMAYDGISQRDITDKLMKIPAPKHR